MLAERDYALTSCPRLLAMNPERELKASLDSLVAYIASFYTQLYFIQVGACDGVFADPIHQLVRKYGMHGILIEPQPNMFQALRHNYRDVSDLQFVNAAICSASERVTLFRVKDQYAELLPWGRGLASLDRNSLKRSLNISIIEHSLDISNVVQEIDDLIEPCSCATETLDNILERTRYPRIDLLLIDAEGKDYEVLQTLSFNEMKPTVVQFEHSHMTSKIVNACYEFLFKHGYKISRGMSDTIAMLDKFTNPHVSCGISEFPS